MPSPRDRTPGVTPRTLIRAAYAKINLCLSVGPAQPPGTRSREKDVSGYHRTASWMACINLNDDIAITRKPEGDLSTCEIVWAGDAPRPTAIDWSLTDDLAWRAHGAMEKKAGRLLPIDLVVTKRIPVGGGLGGGSSDAACVLLTLNQLFELGLKDSELHAVAMSLGSDVAFFVDSPETDESQHDEDVEASGDDGDGRAEDGGSGAGAPMAAPRPALVSSLGEVIDRVEAVEAEVVLVVPPYGCPTRLVYSAFDELLMARVASKKAQIAAHKGDEAAERYEAQDAREDLVLRRIEKAQRAGEIDGDSLFNDLFLPAVKVEPRVGQLMTALSKATRTAAHLTGSGSCVFLVAEEGKGDRLLAKVRKTLDLLAGGADDGESGKAGAVAMLVRLV